MDDGAIMGELRLGKVALCAHEVFGVLGCSLFCLFAWLCFGYGFCDSADGGAGYLGIAVPVSFAVLFVACLVSFFGFRLLEALKLSQAFTLFAGLVCSITAVFLPAFSPIAVSDGVRSVLTVVNTCALSWCLFICVHTVSVTKSTLKLCVISHLIIPTMFVLNGMFFVFSRSWSLMLFAIVPVMGSVMLVLAARTAPDLSFEGPRDFWFMPLRRARSCSACGRMDVSALVGPRYASVRKLLLMALVSLFLTSFYIAFVRYAVLQGSSGIDSHSVGASGGLGLMAIAAMVALSVVLTTGRHGSMHVYYLVSCLGMCFAALVVLLINESNQPVVRVIENASYILYTASMAFALTSWVATIDIYAGNLFSLVGAVVSAGTVAGWLCQGALFAWVGEEYIMRISFFAATFVIFAYVLFGFTAQRYRQFVALGEAFQNAERFAAAQDELSHVPVVWHDCRDLLARAALIEESQTEQVPMPAGAGPSSNGSSDGGLKVACAPGGVRSDDDGLSQTPAAGEKRVSDAQSGESRAVDAYVECAGGGCGAAGGSREGRRAPEAADAAEGAEAQRFERHAPRNGISFREAAAESAQIAGLSKREFDVLLMLLKGYSDQRIAEELVLSYHTVRSHVRHIYTKMDVHNREEISDYVNAVQSRHAPGR